ncbi:AAA family ATPase [uncultured Duncaniella sp.]|uniref:AAA family ATPase n=1 Tax=uncultured Duncaniella sp. TaxID=2768039 RepID=UPI00262B3297|nr:AAA family ATPase [uncultured Duncaniella sp.]
MTDQQYKQEAEQPAGNAEGIHIALDDNGVLTVSGKGELYPYFDFNPLANIAPDPTDPMGFLAKMQKAQTLKAEREAMRRNVRKLIVDGAVEDLFENRPCEFFPNLEDVEFSNGLVAIPEGAFSGAGNLRSVILPGSLEVIGDNAFHDCGKLGRIRLPESIREIGYGAFDRCYEMELENPEILATGNVEFNRFTSFAGAKVDVEAIMNGQSYPEQAHEDDDSTCYWDNHDPFEEFVGMPEVKARLSEFAETVEMLRKSGRTNVRPQCDTIIMGATGTGKTLLAHVIAVVLYRAGLLTNKQCFSNGNPCAYIIDASDWKNTNISQIINDLRGGILAIDNAHKLVTQEFSGSVDALDTLFTEMDKCNGNPTVVLMGQTANLREYMLNNPAARRRFEYLFVLDEYTDRELAEICRQELLEEYEVTIDDEAMDRLTSVFQYQIIRRPEGWSNAHVAVAKAEELFISMTRRGGDSVTAGDVKGETYRRKSYSEIMSELDGFVGIDNIRAELSRIISRVEQDREENGKATFDMHFSFIGNPGTGKTTIARKMAEILKSLDVLKVGHLVEATRADMVAEWLGQTAPKTNALIDSAMGGVLFIDEAYTLINRHDDSFGKEAVDTLLKRLSDDKGKFVCIVASYPNEMFDFMQSNPGLRRRFNKEIRFNDYNGPELTEIFRRSLSRRNLMLDEAAEKHLGNFFDILYAQRANDFGNAGTVENILSTAIERRGERLRKLKDNGQIPTERDKLLTRADIEGIEATRELNLNEVMAEIENSFIGMDNVKKELRRIGKSVQLMQMQAAIGASAEPFAMHLMLTGNPGTGKTEVSRKLGKVLKSIKVLPTDEVIETTKADYVGASVAETVSKTEDMIRRAMGKILFIDEAYQLASDSNGREAIETLMKRMSDYKGKFVVVLAGYRKEMNEFLDVDPGLSRRITHKIHIEDYKADELLQILLKMADKQGLVFAPDAERKARIAVEGIVARKGKNFGNAGEMEKLLKEIRTRMSERLLEAADFTSELLKTIEAPDIPGADNASAGSIEDVMAELDGLVGLDNVKQEIRTISNNLRVMKMMAEMDGKPFMAPADHYIFLGNPGTGKTTVARIMGKIFHQLGVVPTTTFVEADRAALVAEYVGQTAAKTSSVIDSALGGVLFIDEAYTLAQGGPSDFGIEAIGTLLKRMEDDRGKFICIVAGYNDEMSQFLNSNSGLSDRFNKTLQFEDYDADALAHIFRNQAKSQNLTMDASADEAMTTMMKLVYEGRGKNFGNARAVRKILSLVTNRRNERLVAMMSSGNMPTPEQMHEIRPEDFRINYY